MAGNLKWIQNSKGHRFSVNILGRENFSAWMDAQTDVLIKDNSMLESQKLSSPNQQRLSTKVLFAQDVH